MCYAGREYVIIRVDPALVYGTYFWQNQTLTGARLNLSVNINSTLKIELTDSDEQPPNERSGS